MSAPRKIMLTGLAATATVLSAAVTAPAAHAIVNQNYDVATPYDGNGSARAYGDLTWYDRTKFAISGRVNDRCPGDGYGAYFDVEVLFMDGHRVYIPIAKDTGGCGDENGEAFSRTVDRDGRIRSARLCVFEQDATTGHVQDFRCVTKDNPYTGG